MYPLLVILCVAAILCAIRLVQLPKPNSTATPTELSDNIVQLNSKLFGESLCDSCTISGDKLTCSPSIIKKILANVETTSLKSVSENSITFNLGETKGFIEVPAAVIANMADLKLFKPQKEQTDGK